MSHLPIRSNALSLYRHSARIASSCALVRQFALTILLVAFCHPNMAATITSNGTGGGNWGTAASWAGGILPATTDHVIIAAGDQINQTTNQTCVNLTLNGSLNMNTNSRTLTVNGSFTMNGTGSILGSSNTRIINIAGPLVVASGANANVAGCVISVNGTTLVDGSLTFSNNTSTKTFTGDVTVNGSIFFSANQTLTLGGQLISGAGSTIGNGSNIGTLNVANGLSAPAGSSRSLNNLVLTCAAPSTILGTLALGGGTFTFTSLQIAGNGVLNASGATNALRVSGNWSDASLAADPFVEGANSTVTFNGTTGTQLISCANGTEGFYNLVFVNISGAIPAISCLANIIATNDLDHTVGVLDLNGRAMTITGSATAQTHAFSNGSMVSSISGASFTVTDPSNVNMITFTGYRIGTASQGITTNVTCGRILPTGFKQWGQAAFTKTLNVDDVFGGGNYYNGPVTFTAASTASRWRMGDNVALPDTFVNATFNANAVGGSNNNFIICANSLGNAFYGTTAMSSSTVGGFYICRSNGNGNASATFFGPVTARVTLTGNIAFANSSTSNSTSVTFHNTVQAQSGTLSTGDIYFGDGAQSTVTLSPTAQFIQGTVQGQTSVYFRNVTQSGPLSQTMIGIHNTRIYCGGSAYPVLFNGPTTLKADTVQISASTFNNVASAWGLSHLTLANSAFNGETNVFTKEGTANSTSTGGNSFITGSNNNFISTGTGYFRLGNTVADDMNGHSSFQQSGTGALQPAYGPYSTFAGNISTTGTTVAVQFGSVILDGASQQLLGDAAQPPVFLKLTTTLSGILTMNVNARVNTTLLMTSGRVNLNTRTLSLGTSAAAAGALTYTAGWLYGGSFTRWFPTTAVTLGAVGGLFPMGNSTTEYRPLWFGSTSNLTTGGTLTVQHTPTTSGVVSASHFDASWGSSLQGVSNAAWIVSTANSLAVSASTAAFRYGGTGLSPFVLSDLNASQQTSVIGNHSAATNSVVPLEVNRTALNTAALTRTWLIGTRNVSTSPLPIELIAFTAALNSTQVDLDWTTGSELNNDHFTVQRSVDGIAFEDLFSVSGSGTTAISHNYHAIDPSPLRNVSYYRLKQTDFDGEFTLSDVVHINNTTDDGDLTMFPNPLIGGTLNLELQDQVSPTVLFVLFDAAGRVVFQRTLSADISGHAAIDRSELDDLSTGIYQVVVDNGRTLRHSRLYLQ